MDQSAGMVYQIPAQNAPKCTLDSLVILSSTTSMHISGQSRTVMWVVLTYCIDKHGQRDIIARCPVAMCPSAKAFWKRFKITF